MAWLQANITSVLTIALVVSETAAAITQVLAPSNKGVTGVFAGIIKFLQSLGAKEPPKVG